jgi:excisionase family DNA binding protein
MFKYANKEQLTAKQTAKYTGYSLGTIYNYTSNGEIPYSNPTGGKLLFNKAEIDKWLEDKRGESEEIENQVTELENNLLDSKTLSSQTNIIDVLNDMQEEEVRHDNFYIGMIDTIYGSDGELHICQGQKTVTFDATDLFHWLDSIVSTTIKQRKDSDELILNNLRDALQENK